MIGRTLSHYRILAELGKGGMGELYQAQDLELDRRVALKVLPKDVSSVPERLERFRREAKALAALSHPNIVTIFSVEEAEGVHFISMELVEGKTLSELIPPAGLELDNLLDIAIPMADALRAAHNRGIIHRDLKPTNVMIDDDFRVKILDFGLAKLQPTDADLSASSLSTENLTQEGRLLGTLPYMSPEQIQGQSVDGRSDLFSLGIMLYEMATGQRPFKGEGPAQLLSSILRDSPSPVTVVKPTLSHDFERIIEGSLVKDPTLRTQTASVLLEQLKQLRGEAAAEGRASGPSIAVLPFADMSPEKDQDYFCEGIAEEIIIALAKVKGLHVASRTSAFQFKAAVDSREIGRRLGVNTFLEGSVRKAGDRLRITTELINAADGYHLWSERFDRRLHDVFAIQDEIAQAVVDTLKIKLVGADPEPVYRPRTPDFSAYNLNLKGRYFWSQRTEQGLFKAKDYFEQAIQKDPDYAPAYASLADTQCLLCSYHLLSPEESIPDARRAASRSLELDETLAEAHEALAHVRILYEWNWVDAEREYRRALELNRSFATAHQRLALLLTVMGRLGEARAEIERAQELDPLSFIIQTDSALVWLIAGRNEEAISTCHAVLEMAPDFGIARFALGLALEQQGLYDAAVEEFRRAVELSGATSVMTGALGHALGRSGDGDGARETLRRLDKLSPTRYVSPYTRALVWVGLGKENRALAELDRALEERSAWQIHLHLKADPRLAPLREKRAFTHLLAQMGLAA